MEAVMDTKEELLGCVATLRKAVSQEEDASDNAILRRDDGDMHDTFYRAS
jgi:hypothetical protein